MLLATIAVIAAALCSGSAAVLQASAVRRMPAARSVGAHFVAALARSPRYLAALALIAAGFALSVLALRTLPVYVVQSARASSLVVTAVLSVLVLGARLRRVELGAFGAVAVGLVLLALSTGPQQAAVAAGSGTRFAVLTGVCLLGALAVLTLRRAPSGMAGPLLAALAGGAFALLALATRLAPSLHPLTLLTDPAGWAMGLAGFLGLLLGALALQRASVVPVTATMVAVETVTGALLGVVVCGDRPIGGAESTAVAAVALVLAGALLLARFGAPEADRMVLTRGPAAPASR